MNGNLKSLGLDTAYIVRCSGVQGLHKQVEGVSELHEKKSRKDQVWSKSKMT